MIWPRKDIETPIEPWDSDAPAWAMVAAAFVLGVVPWVWGIIAIVRALLDLASPI